MSQRDIDVVAAGHVCVDIAPSFGEVAGASVAEVLRPGCVLQVGPVSITTGGAVPNTGIALRRLGLNVSMMGKCGDDLFGRAILDVLRREAPGSEAGMRVVPGEHSSYTVIVALPGIDRMFFDFPGSNDTFGAEDVDMDLVRRARLLHFGYPPLMKRMYTSRGRELAALLEGVRDVGTVTSLDLALPDANTPAGRADWRAIFSSVLPHTDVFLPSLEEIMLMIRRERYDELLGTEAGIIDGCTADDLRGLADECLEMGARIVVIKCGHLGAYFRTAKSFGESARRRGLADVLHVMGDWEGVEMFEPTCRVEKIVSAAGSGDCAIAGFLAALLHGEPPAWCMAALAAVGAQNLSALDTVSGVLSWEETMAQVQGELVKNPVPERLAGLMQRDASAAD